MAPVAPAEPVAPVAPAEPVAPVAPAEPVAPVAPVAPAVPLTQLKLPEPSFLRYVLALPWLDGKLVVTLFILVMFPLELTINWFDEPTPRLPSD